MNDPTRLLKDLPLPRPCERCGLTGAPMVDWQRYAGELVAVLREVRAWVRMPPHLVDATARLLGEGSP